MAEATIIGRSAGTALMSIIDSDEIQPGDDPSYQLCKTIYLYHPFGAKMVDTPIQRAIEKPREITVKTAEDRVLKAFLDQWEVDGCENLVKQHGGVSRIYGVGALCLGVEGQNSADPIKWDTLWKDKIFFNVVDPLNTAGSIAMNQDPNAPDFQKHTTIAVAGQAYHRSRTCVLMNERPIYIAWSNSGFGYVGRSVYQRALFPMKAFVQSMITDWSVTEKIGLLIAKVAQAGSIGDKIMAGASAFKRLFLKGARTGNVLSIGVTEDIASLNFQNVDGAGGWARTNIVKNIATAADMPAVFLENETLTQGFGEGTEDAKQIAVYLGTVRVWLSPIYAFLDPIIQRRAWNPEFFATMQAEFPERYGKMKYEAALMEWINGFSAIWPDLIKESKKDILDGVERLAKIIFGVIATFMPRCDPENAAELLKWSADTLNAQEDVFPVKLNLDWEAMATYEPPAPAMGQGEGILPGEAEPEPKKPITDSMALGGAPGRLRLAQP